jgi:hypothetical protein
MDFRHDIRIDTDCTRHQILVLREPRQLLADNAAIDLLLQQGVVTREPPELLPPRFLPFSPPAEWSPSTVPPGTLNST